MYFKMIFYTKFDLAYLFLQTKLCSLGSKAFWSTKSNLASTKLLTCLSNTLSIFVDAQLASLLHSLHPLLRSTRKPPSLKNVTLFTLKKQIEWFFILASTLIRLSAIDVSKLPKLSIPKARILYFLYDTTSPLNCTCSPISMVWFSNFKSRSLTRLMVSRPAMLPELSSKVPLLMKNGVETFGKSKLDEYLCSACSITKSTTLFTKGWSQCCCIAGDTVASTRTMNTNWDILGIQTV